MGKSNRGNRQNSAYGQILATVFENHYCAGCTEFLFDREEIEQAALDLGVNVPKNLGDVLYSYRYRGAKPQCIKDTESRSHQWIICGAGRSQYKFKFCPITSLIPRDDIEPLKIPEATPEIIDLYSLSDEQALLAQVRYNRLVDVFLGLTTYSLQNHLRTSVEGIGQIEIDEIYIGLDKMGKHYIIPVQAKRGGDSLGAVQALQDIAYCRQRFEGLIVRSLSVQFLTNNVIVIFELTENNGDVRVVEEKHYQLVPATDFTA